jgi:hypothetical protein
MFNISSEIKRIAKESLNCSFISLSHFCNGEDKLYMTHLGQLKFTLIDEIKPQYYNEILMISDNHWKLVEKENKYRELCIAYNYPYIEEKKPERWVAETCGAYLTGNYYFAESVSYKVPDYNEIERIIYEVLNKFKLLNK